VKEIKKKFLKIWDNIFPPSEETLLARKIEKLLSVNKLSFSCTEEGLGGDRNWVYTSSDGVRVIGYIGHEHDIQYISLFYASYKGMKIEVTKQMWNQCNRDFDNWVRKS